MTSARHMQTAFLAGETSPLMNGRVETEHHAYGLATCENFVPFLEGPLVKRPGFAYICDAAATASWLSAFRFNVTQEYALEWSAAKLRFFTNGGRIETAPGVPYEVVTPYAAADAPRLCSQQSFDRLYLTHASYAPAALSRTGAAAFAHATLTLTNGPFADENPDDTITVTASAATGSGITLTASSAIFLAGHVGALFRIDAKDFSTIKVWEPGMLGIVAGEIVRSDGKAYTAATSGTTGSSTPIHDEGTEWDGQGKQDINAKPTGSTYGVQWTYRHGRYGVVKITAIGGGGTTATADVVARLPDSVVTVATDHWRHAAFSAAAGWPALVFKWLGRLGFLKDFDLLASVAGSYLDFSSETSSGVPAADLAFRRRLDVADAPVWAVADTKLLLGTATRELAVGPINQTAAVSGENIRSDKQSAYGSASVIPVEAGTQTLFVERGGRRLRASDYDYARDRFDAPDLTAAAQHVTKSGIAQLAVQRTPQAMLHAVRSDGQIVVHPLTRGDLKGFARIVPGGAAKVLSVVSIVGADGIADELWLLVERTRHDGLKREIWQQAAWRELGDAPPEQFFVDGGVRIAATAGQVHFTGLTHLSGQAVAVLADGGVVTDMVIDGSGALTLPASAVPADRSFVVIVGLAYTATAVTRTPALSLGKGPADGLKMRLVKVALRLLETFGLRAGAGDGPQDELIDRSAADHMDTAPPLFSGDTAGPIDSGFARDGSCTIVSAVPLAAVVTAAMLKLNVDDTDA